MASPIDIDEVAKCFIAAAASVKANEAAFKTELMMDELAKEETATRRAAAGNVFGAGNSKDAYVRDFQVHHAVGTLAVRCMRDGLGSLQVLCCR